MITAEIMLAIWTGVALLAIYVSHRTRFPPLLFVASAALTWIVFYGMTTVDAWSSMDFAVNYSRWGNAWSAANLVMMLLAIYRGRAHGLD